MQGENKFADLGVESVSPPSTPASGHPRRTLIRAALLSVPLVLSLTPKASAQGPGGTMPSGGVSQQPK